MSTMLQEDQRTKGLIAEQMKRFKKLRIGDPVGMRYGTDGQRGHMCGTYFMGIANDSEVYVISDAQAFGNRNNYFITKKSVMEVSTYRETIVEKEVPLNDRLFGHGFCIIPPDTRKNMFDELGIEVKEKAMPVPLIPA